MEEKKGIKVSLTAAILFFLLILAIVGVALVYTGLQGKYEAEKIALQEQVNVVENKVEELAEKQTKEEVVVKQENNKDFVYTIYEDKPSEFYSYKVPKININSEYAKKANQEIEKDILKPLKSGEFYYGIVDYNSYMNENILSVVLKMEHKMYPEIIYKVYNINLKTGEEFNNREILKFKNITEEEYLNKLQNALGEYFINWFGQNGEIPQELKDNQYNATISRDNYSIDNLMFLDDTGKINAVAKIYTLAGSGEAWTIIKL